MNDFFAMGGYAFYVWTSVALFVLMLVWDGLSPTLKMRRLLRELARREQREQAAAARRAPTDSRGTST